MTIDVEPVRPGDGARDGASLLFIFGVLVAVMVGGLRLRTDGLAGADPALDLWIWVPAIVTTLSTAGVIALVSGEYRAHRRFTIGVALVVGGLAATVGAWWVIGAA
jgi:hypothetical protein